MEGPAANDKASKNGSIAGGFAPSPFRGPEPHKTIAERLRELRQAYGDRDRWVPLFNNVLLPVNDSIAEVQARHSNLIAHDPLGYAKHFDIVFYMQGDCYVAERLELLTAAPQKILDIGAGVGRLALLCKYFGHEVTSIDIDLPPLEDIAKALGVERHMVRVTPEVPLPDFGKRFSVVTALGIMFNILRSRPSWEFRYWSLEQWQFLLRDLMWNQMTYPAKIYFDLNRETRGGQSVFNAELLTFCADHGAEVVAERGRILWRLDEPALPSNPACNSSAISLQRSEPIPAEIMRHPAPASETN